MFKSIFDLNFSCLQTIVRWQGWNWLMEYEVSCQCSPTLYVCRDSKVNKKKQTEFLKRNKYYIQL